LDETGTKDTQDYVAGLKDRRAIIDAKLNDHEALLDERAAIDRMLGAYEPLPASPPPTRVRKPRSDKGTSKKEAKTTGGGGAAIHPPPLPPKHAPVGSPEVLTEPGAEKYARKAGSF